MSHETGTPLNQPVFVTRTPIQWIVKPALVAVVTSILSVLAFYLIPFAAGASLVSTVFMVGGFLYVLASTNRFTGGERIIIRLGFVAQYILWAIIGWLIFA